MSHRLGHFLLEKACRSSFINGTNNPSKHYRTISALKQCYTNVQLSLNRSQTASVAKRSYSTDGGSNSKRGKKSESQSIADTLDDYDNSNSEFNLKDSAFGVVPKVEVGPASIKINIPSDIVTKEGKIGVRTLQFLHVWLRDSCRCPKCIHSSSGQKLHSSADIPLSIKPAHVIPGREHIRVFWPTENLKETHESIYPVSWLLEYADKDIYSTLGHDDAFKPVPWSVSNLDYTPVEYSALDTTKGMKDMLQKIKDYGVCFVKGIPLEGNQKETFDRVTHKIGPNRLTFYGRTWDVKSVKQATNIAYTGEFLGLHMDLMYYENPPALQLLFCVKNEVKGGASMFSDIYHAVDVLEKLYPEDYKALCDVYVTFHYNKDGHAMRFKRPTIVPSRIPGGRPKIYFSPPFMGPLECNPLDAARFYKAFTRLNMIIEDESNKLVTRLEPGTCAIFHNVRVLHARDSFDPSEGDRHLLGTYVAWDYFAEKYRLLHSN